MNASYNPKGDEPLRRPIISIRAAPALPAAVPVRTFGKLERRDPPLAAICPPDKCMMQSSKEQPVPACSGPCRLASFKPDPVLPKPPAFPKAS